MSTTMSWSRDSAAGSVRSRRQALLEIAPARTLVERERCQYIRAQRQLALLAHDAAARVDQLGLRDDAELDLTGRRLAGRQIAGDAGSGVVLEGHAMADQVVELRVIRHAGFPISRRVSPGVTAAGRP